MHHDFDFLMTVHYPDDLAEAFGYNSDAHYVGFYWDHAGDELTWLDGRRPCAEPSVNTFSSSPRCIKSITIGSVTVTPCPLTTCSSIGNPIIFM